MIFLVFVWRGLYVAVQDYTVYVRVNNQDKCESSNAKRYDVNEWKKNGGRCWKAKGGEGALAELWTEIWADVNRQLTHITALAN